MSDAARPVVDPAALEAAATGWDNRLQAAALGLLVVVASAYPLLLDTLTLTLGLRVVASLLAGFSLAAAALGARRGRSAVRVFAGAVLAGVSTVAAMMGDVVPLRLVPALIHFGVAVVFLASLRGEESLVERGARMIQPVAPSFIGPYCRLVTALWGIVMGVNAAVLAWCALAASPEEWQAAAGWQVWAWMGAVGLAEFLVRKTYFRNYFYGGPFERVWSRWFPAEETEMGRRSAEYIRDVRGKLAERESAARGIREP